MLRHPVVTGKFYPAQPEALRGTVAKLLPKGAEARAATGIISPHAGYLYSGAIAGATFAQVTIPARVVLLGPNHHGLGHPAAVFPGGSWQTPLGQTTVDRELAGLILQGCSRMGADTVAHRFEHSLEVQIPFLQFLAPAATIVPICLASAPLPELLALGEALGGVLAALPEAVLLVVSSDMTHYEPGEAARRKDMAALERIFDLDPEGLFETVRRMQITMCGLIPTVVMLAAARRLGARKGTLVRYGNSGEVTGDQSQVVGYAGVIVD